MKTSRLALGMLGVLVGTTLQTRGAAEPGAAADEHLLTELEVVTEAVKNNADLHVALLSEQQAQLGTVAEGAFYTPIFSASAGITHLRDPSLRADGDVALGSSDTLDVSAGIRKTYPFGTTLAFELSGQRSLRTSPVLPTSGTELTLGPGYSILGRLSATQPLLRGSGSELGLAPLRAARYQYDISTLRTRETASTLLRSVLQAYYELWYKHEARKVYSVSRDFARTQAELATSQAESGAIATIDALSYQTTLAELEEAVTTASADLEQSEFALEALIGAADADARRLRARNAPELEASTSDDSAGLKAAFAASYELQRLAREIRLAQDQARIAADALRPKLDLEGYVQARGLGNREVPPALEQAAGLEAYGAHLALVFETATSNTRRTAERERATLAARVAEQQLAAAKQKLRADYLRSLSQRDAAVKRLQVAEQTSAIAKKQVEAERARFALGSSIALQVQQADNSLRQAELRLLRARADWAVAQLTLDHLSARLLDKYRSVLGKITPRPLASFSPGAF